MRIDFNSTWTNTRVNKDRIHKVPSSNCNHRLVYVWVWHIHSNGNWCNKLNISFWQYRCNSEFSVFLAFELRFIILFWDICDLLDRVCRPRCWFVSDKASLFITVVNAFEFKEVTEVQNVPLKTLLEDDETRARSCKYPTPPCALAKILLETTVCA